MAIKKECSNCHGTGTIKKSETVSVSCDHCFGTGLVTDFSQQAIPTGRRRSGSGGIVVGAAILIIGGLILGVWLARPNNSTSNQSQTSIQAPAPAVATPVPPAVATPAPPAAETPAPLQNSPVSQLPEQPPAQPPPQTKRPSQSAAPVAPPVARLPPSVESTPPPSTNPPSATSRDTGVQALTTILPHEERSAERPQSLAFHAVHRHSFGSCQGTLTFTPTTVQFESDKEGDSFTYPLDAVKLEKDGIDAGGKKWHFEIRGENAGAVFVTWKFGTMRFRTP